MISGLTTGDARQDSSPPIYHELLIGSPLQERNNSSLPIYLHPRNPFKHANADPTASQNRVALPDDVFFWVDFMIPAEWFFLPPRCCIHPMQDPDYPSGYQRKHRYFGTPSKGREKIMDLEMPTPCSGQPASHQLR
jgi:hypothetical protein